jgi:regulator of sirC expression with transglutaminase-like and TPR domain
VAGPDSAVDLGRASLLIACEEYPDLDVTGYLERLDEMGRLLAKRLPARLEAEGAVAVVNRFLFEEQGFKGNADDYYDPRNSFLNQVLDRRTGIPITLSTVYMEVARRAGLPVEGVGLPGHFIVKLTGPERDVLIDPFHRGGLLSEQDCQKRLDRAYGGKLKVAPWMLMRCDRKHILARMLRNLKVIYLKSKDFERALRTVELLLLVNPHSGEDLRDRGLVYSALDCYALAARDLQDYLRRVPGAPEAEQVRERIQEMRFKARHLN